MEWKPTYFEQQVYLGLRQILRSMLMLLVTHFLLFLDLSLHRP